MKRAIVTGAAGLIGRGVCQALIADGWTVAAFDLKPGPDGAQSVICDVGDEASVKAAFDELGWDGLELLVNNAGIAGPDRGSMADLSLADWRKVTDSHLTGAFLMSRAAIPLLGEGSAIIHMVSTRAFMSEPNTEAYAASKGAMVALTHAMAISLGPKVRVNALIVGLVDTEGGADHYGSQEAHDAIASRIPAGRMAVSEDVAKAVMLLVSPLAAYVSGAQLSVDGGGEPPGYLALVKE